MKLVANFYMPGAACRMAPRRESVALTALVHGHALCAQERRRHPLGLHSCDDKADISAWSLSEQFALTVGCIVVCLEKQ